jgi:hypothetical protein
MTRRAQTPRVDAALIEMVLPFHGTFDARDIAEAVACRPADRAELRLGAARVRRHLARLEARGVVRRVRVVEPHGLIEWRRATPVAPASDVDVARFRAAVGALKDVCRGVRCELEGELGEVA